MRDLLGQVRTLFGRLDANTSAGLWIVRVHLLGIYK